MTADEINAYIGRPWQGGANGPEAFDCWGLLEWVQREHFNVLLPDRQTREAEATRLMYRAEMDAGRWCVVPRPFDGCGVLLRDGDRPHVGVYLANDGGGVLHAVDQTGVIYTPRNHLRTLGYARVSWYDLGVSTLPRNDCPAA